MNSIGGWELVWHGTLGLNRGQGVWESSLPWYFLVSVVGVIKYVGCGLVFSVLTCNLKGS